MNLHYICKQKQDHFNSSPALQGGVRRGVLAAPHSELLTATHTGGGVEGSPGEASLLPSLLTVLSGPLQDEQRNQGALLQLGQHPRDATGLPGQLGLLRGPKLQE